MIKDEFANYIAKRNNCTKANAEKTINMFIDGVIGALEEGEDIALVGFGHLYSYKIGDKNVRNPRTGELMQISAHNRVKFKVGKKLKDACNS
jgi:DNA-binding protein HU-beta